MIIEELADGLVKGGLHLKSFFAAIPTVILRSHPSPAQRAPFCGMGIGGTTPVSVSSANSRSSHISCAIAIAAAWVMMAKELKTWKKRMSP